MADGISPSSTMCFFSTEVSAIGTADSKRLGVGVIGRREHLIGVPNSTTWPRYITITRSLDSAQSTGRG